MTNRTYTREEMIGEIVDSIAEIGGEVVVLPSSPGGFTGGFQLFVEQDLMNQAELIVNDIQKKYIKKRTQVLNNNPFTSGVHFKDKTPWHDLKIKADLFKLDIVQISNAKYHYCISFKIGGK